MATNGSTGGVTFGDKPSFSSDYSLFDYAPSGDGKAFTIRFGPFEVTAGNAGEPSSATKEFAVTLPLSGKGPVQTSLVTQGFALVTGKASGSLTTKVNGKAKVFEIAPGFDGEVIQKFNIDSDGMSEMRIEMTIAVENDPTDEESSATIKISTLDADLTVSKSQMPPKSQAKQAR